ncbi:hypothetical protein OK016_05955 [Vibrio chagasii]|nr:hypothetical protein [Vibrio chagasii]
MPPSRIPQTIPGLRSALKYVVACGGGFNHRIGVF